MSFTNSYGDSRRAESYAALEFPGTYHLAYRDLPDLIRHHTRGNRAMDFGCGAGRSTRFLMRLGFEVIGVDISQEMIRMAQTLDPEGDYRLIPDGGMGQMRETGFDLILSAFTFDNVPSRDHKVRLFAQLAEKLSEGGKIVSLVSSEDIYVHEWASFTTKDFPENKSARSGDTVRIVMTDVDDARPIEDILCTQADYLEIYKEVGLVPVTVHRPLGREDEPFAWVNETRISPWSIAVLRKAD